MRGRCEHCGDWMVGENPSDKICMDCMIDVDEEEEMELLDSGAFICSECGDVEPDFSDSYGICNACSQKGAPVYA